MEFLISSFTQILTFCFTLFSLRAHIVQSQCLIPRVERAGTYATVTTPTSGSQFYVPLRQRVQFYCYCKSFRRVQIIQDDVAVSPWESCDVVVHTIRNTTYSDEGKYMCRAEATDGSTFETPLGNMSVIDPNDIAQADPVQYGILNTPTTLNCSSSFDVFNDLVNIKWFRGQRESGKLLSRWAEFNPTEQNHGGLYTCQVYISRIDVRLEKRVQFIVLGTATTSTASSMMTPTRIHFTSEPPPTPPTTTPPVFTSHPPPVMNATDIGGPHPLTTWPIMAVTYLLLLLLTTVILLLILCIFVFYHFWTVSKCHTVSRNSPSES